MGSHSVEATRRIRQMPYEVMMLAKEIKEKFPSKTIWLYTGYEWKDIKNMDIVNYLDVLVDGEFEVEKKELDLHWKGGAEPDGH